MVDKPTETATDADDGWEWAAVEIFGHRSHIGRAREEERFGTKMLRIDVPVDGNPTEKGWSTHYYGGASIFSYQLTDEKSAMKANKPYAAPAITRYRDDYDREQHDDDDENGNDDHSVSGDAGMNTEPTK